MNTAPETGKAANTHFLYDVIIAGAGPAGLFLACELALAKCSVLILEKAGSQHSPLKKLPFGIRGLSAPSVEALYRRDLLNELEIHKRLKNPHSTPKPVQGKPVHRQTGHFAGIPLYDDNIDTSEWKYRLPGSTPTQLLSEMEELETVLTRRAEALGAEIRRGHACTGFRQTADGVSVQSGYQSFNCKWLVGCDGSRSIVRKTAGFEFAGTEPEFTGYSVLADIADPEKLMPGRNVTPTGMYLQSQPGYIIIQDFDAGEFHNSDKPITPEHVQEVLRRVSNTDVIISALHTATTWTDRARQATSYCKGNVLLAGDAAHIHSPLGGQGLNLGLGDAMNLGWKLAATINGNAPVGLLDTYFSERYPVGEKVLEWSRAQVLIMKPNLHSRALNAIMRDLTDTTDGATYMAGRIWGVHAQYSLNGHHPLTGRSVPNFELHDGTFTGELMHEGKGLLLDFDSNSSIKALATEYSKQIRYIPGNVKERLSASAVLIRPDGVVAWAAGTEPDYNELRMATDLWFTRNSGSIC
ncbi:MAG: FAD-dependent monooxygenase [Bacteroidota bacterium]